MSLPPLLLTPHLSPAIWGGDALVTRFGKHGERGDRLGESWECWDANRVAGGPFAGRSVAELRAELGRALTGPLEPAAPLPVLTKLIDACDTLSVQVHPDDAYARRVEGEPNGKTECWAILDAEPGAEIILGWVRDVTRAEVERRAADGSLGEVLRRLPARAGDVFHLPAGTVHAIGAGIRLFEAQQTSDLTYRLFDWNRRGTDGRPRRLHLEKALDVLDLRAARSQALPQLAFEEDGARRTLLVAEPNFELERVQLRESGTTLDGAGRPWSLTACDAPLRLAAGGAECTIAPWQTVLVPADCGAVALVPERATAEAFVVRMVPDRAALARAAAASGADGGAIDAFFANFVR